MPHVTQAEAGVLAEAVRRQGAYLFQLKQRMENTGRTADPLYPFVAEAYHAVHRLWVTLHYRGCGITRPPESSGSEDAGTNMAGSP